MGLETARRGGRGSVRAAAASPAAGLRPKGRALAPIRTRLRDPGPPCPPRGTGFPTCLRCAPARHHTWSGSMQRAAKGQATSGRARLRPSPATPPSAGPRPRGRALAPIRTTRRDPGPPCPPRGTGFPTCLRCTPARQHTWSGSMQRPAEEQATSGRARLRPSRRCVSIRTIRRLGPPPAPREPGPQCPPAASSSARNRPPGPPTPPTGTFPVGELFHSPGLPRQRLPRVTPLRNTPEA
jgi:hypothetical protein